MNDSPRVLGNRYEVGEVLGRGGMAEVHIGRDTRLGRTVAIKLLRSDLARDPIFQARFRREALSAASLNHPAIVAVYDTAEEQVVDTTGNVISLPYIVMEYVHGRTVRDLVEQARTRALAAVPPGAPQPPDAGALDVGTALDITTGVLSALEYSHRAGIVHRDIKPANVMVTPAGEIKVMDFGIARALADASATMTQTQAVIGTAQYLSPEQARGETVDARSDLYSAGCLLYELLTGRPPFVADSPVAVAYQHVREYPQPPSALNPAIGEDVDRIVMHALTKDRDVRYQSAAEFRYDVEAAASGRRVAAPSLAGAAAATEVMGHQAARTTAMPAAAGAGATNIFPGADEGYPQPEEEEPQRRGVLYASIALGVLVVAAIIAFLVMRGDGEAQVTQVAVPDVSNLTQAAADIELQNANLVPQFEEESSDDVEEGHVIRTDPEIGTMLDPQSTVTVYVSTGSDTVEVPDLSGMTQDEARAALEGVGLKQGNVSTKDTNQADPGDVIESDPPAGEVVDTGTTVNLIVASGNVVVKNVVGKTIDEARDILNKQGLQVNAVTAPSSEVPPGTVTEQSPVPNTKVNVGTTVNLTVAEEAPTTTTTTEPPPTTTTTEPTTTETTTDDQNGQGPGNGVIQP